MDFQIEHGIAILARTPRVLNDMLRELPDVWTTVNEGPDTWSPYDIVGHLVHGERADWIPRLNVILSDGKKAFEPFDRFAQFENSKGKTLSDLLDEFNNLRVLNIQKLRAIKHDEHTLIQTGIHPDFGEVTLRQLLATWVVHDLNHISQIARVMAKQYKEEVGPWVRYLGILNR